MCDPDPPTSQTDGRTDGHSDRRTTCNLNTALCTIAHLAAKIKVATELPDIPQIVSYILNRRMLSLKALVMWNETEDC